MALEQQDLRQMLGTAIIAARLAGQQAMEELDFLKVSIKNDNELITQADAKCQQIIVDRIKEMYPDHGFIAEEGNGGKMFRLPPRGSDPIWWVIDPIDGTNNFARKVPLFSVSIAACYRNEPIVGVIFEPPTDSMFTAIKGGQAQLNSRRITASEDTISKFSSVGVDSGIEQELPPCLLEIMRRTRFRCLGSIALQIAYVANGGLIGTIGSSQKLWDIAAGAVIAEAAGAVVTDWQGEKIFPVDLDSYTGQRFQTITANKKTHAQILELLRKS
jgi:myo-inositol-1(or 4)-monophosphatase